MESGTSSFFGHTRLPGAEAKDPKHKNDHLNYATLLLPHVPAAEGLWANNLAASGQLDLCTVLPHVEQHLMVSSSPLFILSPQISIQHNTPTIEALEYAFFRYSNMEALLPWIAYSNLLARVFCRKYHHQILDAWRSISTRTKGLNVLAYGAGGASFIMALAADQSLRNSIHKIAFLDCDESIPKILSLTLKSSEGSGSKMWSTSPVVSILGRRAIAFKIDNSPVGSVIKSLKESHCSCPIVSVRKHSIFFETHLVLDADSKVYLDWTN